MYFSSRMSFSFDSVYLSKFEGVRSVNKIINRYVCVLDLRMYIKYLKYKIEKQGLMKCIDKLSLV